MRSNSDHANITSDAVSWRFPCLRFWPRWIWVHLFRNCWIWPFKRENFPPQLAAVILGTVETGIAECYPPWQYSAYPPMSLTRCLLWEPQACLAYREFDHFTVGPFSFRFSSSSPSFYLFFLFVVTFFKTRDNEILNSKCPALPLIRYSINWWHFSETCYHVWLILILAYFNQSSCVDIFSVQLF